MHNLPCLDRQAPENPSIFRISLHWYAILMLAQVQELAYQGMAQVVLAGAGFGIGPGYGFGCSGPAR